MANLLRISIFGAMPTGEEWSVNPCWGLADFGETVTPTQAQTIATALAAVSIPTGLSSLMSTQTTFTGYRVEARNLAGVLETQAQALRSSPSAGSGSFPHPFQTSWVTSLRTAGIGASGRGRLYWPATGQGIADTTLRPTSAQTAAALTAVTSFLTSVQTAIRVTLPGAYLGVWSRKGHEINICHQLQMGDVLDTQRRRRDTLVENYSTGTF